VTNGLYQSGSTQYDQKGIGTEIAIRSLTFLRFNGLHARQNEGVWDLAYPCFNFKSFLSLMNVQLTTVISAHLNIVWIFALYKLMMMMMIIIIIIIIAIITIINTPGLKCRRMNFSKLKDEATNVRK